MRRGHFKFNGEKIHIRSDGTVADGQTRLRACILADKPFKTVVVRGDVEDESNIDTGSKRNAGQLLAYHGVANANSVAAAIKAFIAIFERKSISHLSYSAPIAASEVYQWYQKHPEIENSVRLAAQVPVGMYQALVAAVHYAGMGMDSDHTEWWISALIEGSDLKDGDPVLRLRNRFISSTKRVIIGRVEQAALLIKSWNMSKEGRVLRSLQWRGSGPNPEPFPILGQVEPVAAEDDIMAEVQSDQAPAEKPKPSGRRNRKKATSAA